ncbi:MAG: hypothetical protein WD600_11500, partial [Pseudohongiella sp.]
MAMSRSGLSGIGLPGIELPGIELPGIELIGTALLQPIEFAVNRLIARDPHIIGMLAKAAKDKTIAVRCTSMPRWQISLLITADRILLMSN